MCWNMEVGRQKSTASFELLLNGCICKEGWKWITHQNFLSKCSINQLKLFFSQHHNWQLMKSFIHSQIPLLPWKNNSLPSRSRSVSISAVLPSLPHAVFCDFYDISHSLRFLFLDYVHFSCIICHRGGSSICNFLEMGANASTKILDF
jgi:hypothetical protein